MTVNSEKLEKISKKIRALMEKTVANGATEAEAVSAADKVQELMNIYDLSMSDVEINTQEFVDGKIITGKSTTQALHDMVTSISIFTDTKVWFQRTRTSAGIVYHFFGARKDVDFAHFLCDLFTNSIELEIKRYKKTAGYKYDSTNGRTKCKSFRMGMTTRLRQRLLEIKANRMSANQERGLILYDKSKLVEDKYNDMIGGDEICRCPKNMMKEPEKRKKYKDCCGKLKNERRKRTASYKAYYSGVNAGDNVTITTGLNKSKHLSLK